MDLRKKMTKRMKQYQLLIAFAAKKADRITDKK